MYCYVCAERFNPGENYCRGCGVPAANSQTSQISWLATVGHFANGILGFGLFVFLFVFWSTDFIRFTPFGRYLVIALAGGFSLGLAIHLYSRSRRIINPVAKEISDDKPSLDLLPEPSATSFLSVSEGLNVPTTSKLKVPR